MNKKYFYILMEDLSNFNIGMEYIEEVGLLTACIPNEL